MNREAIDDETLDNLPKSIEDTKLKIEQLQKVRDSLSWYQFYKKWQINKEIAVTEIYLEIFVDLSNFL